MALLHFLQNLGFSHASSPDTELYGHIRGAIELLHDRLHTIQGVPGLEDKQRGMLAQCIRIIDYMDEHFVWNGKPEADIDQQSQIRTVLNALADQADELIKLVGYLEEHDFDNPEDPRELMVDVEKLHASFMDGLREMRAHWRRYCQEDKKMVLGARKSLRMLVERSQVYDCVLGGEESRIWVFMQGRNDPVKLRLLPYLVLPHPEQNVDFLPRNPVEVRLHTDDHLPIPHYNIEVKVNGSYRNIHAFAYDQSSAAREFLHQNAA